jgi:hypothetical protein
MRLSPKDRTRICVLAHRTSIYQAPFFAVIILFWITHFRHLSPGQRPPSCAVCSRPGTSEELSIEGVCADLGMTSVPNGLLARHFLVPPAPSPKSILRFGPTARERSCVMKSHKTATGRRFALFSLVVSLLVLAGTAEMSAPRGLAQSSTLPNTFGEQKTLVVLVNFQNNPTSQPYTVDSVRSLIFGNVSNFYYESSYSRTWLTGDVYGWFTIPMDSTVCDTYALSQYANAAAVAAGADLSTYSRYVYIFPGNSCNWAGITLKSSNSVPRVYLNGSFNFKDVAHELGHSFGLDHSAALDCGAASIGSSCTMIEYGDKFDDMGGAPYQFNAYQKERLGWLNSGTTTPPITTVESTGTYFIEPLETLSAGGAKALKILKSVDPVTGDKTWYYVESRQPVGFDSSLASNSNVVNGVLLHQATQFSDSFNLFFSYLLDMTPETSSWFDPALAVGRTFQDSTAGFSIAPIACSSAGCSVFVSFSSQASECVNTSPTLAITPYQPAPVLPGTPVTFSVTVRNNDTASCSSDTFNLQASVPSGWSAVFGSPSVVIGPGASASTTVTVTPPPTAVVGTYSLVMSATNSAAPIYSNSASVVFSVAAPQLPATVTVTTDKSSYSLNSIATTRGVVLRGTTPVSGANVTFTITKSNGSRVTINGTTGTDGNVTAKYRLNKKDPKGNYKDEASTSVNGSLLSATTSFMVQ